MRRPYCRYLDLPRPMSGTGTCDISFWSRHLQIHYNLALLILHRAMDGLSTGIVSAEQRVKSQEICPAVTSSLLELFEWVIATGDTSSLWFSSVPVPFAASISIASELNLSAQQRPIFLTLQTHTKLDRVLSVLHKVACYWPVADAVHKIFGGSQSTGSAEKVQSIRRHLELTDTATGGAIAPVTTTDAGATYSTFSLSRASSLAPDLLSWPGWQDVLGAGGVPIYATERFPREYGWLSL